MNKDNQCSLLDELIDETKDPLEKTLEIKNFNLEEDELNILNIEETKKPEKKKKRKFLPMTTAEENHLQYAFVHCSILGFITAFIGGGMLAYIINNI